MGGTDPSFNSVLINISSGLGDALMAEPLVRALHTYRADLRIGLVCSALTRQVFENHPAAPVIHLMDTRWVPFLSLASRLRKASYDLYIGSIPSNTYSQISAPVLAGIPFRIKHRTPHCGRRDLDFLFQKIIALRADEHRVDGNCDLVKALGIDVAEGERAPQFAVVPEAEHSAKEKLIKAGWDPSRVTVGFHPGCSPKAAFKRWDPRRYAALSDLLTETYGVQVLIVGSADEKEDVRILTTSVRHPVLDLAGHCSLAETAGAIKQCQFFISNDSGIMHLAAAVDIPTFALFGPKDERHVGPYGKRHTVIRNGTEVNNITVEQVVATLEAAESGLKHLPN